MTKNILPKDVSLELLSELLRIAEEKGIAGE